MQRLVICSAVLLGGLVFISAFSGTARAEDVSSPPGQSAQPSVDSVASNAAPADLPESPTTTDATPGAETPSTTADAPETSTTASGPTDAPSSSADTSATGTDATGTTASGPTDAPSSSADTSATGTDATGTPGSTSGDPATGAASSSCATNGAVVPTNTADTSGGTTDGTDTSTVGTGSEATAATTTDSVDTCAGTSDGTDAATVATVTAPAPAPDTTDSTDTCGSTSVGTNATTEATVEAATAVETADTTGICGAAPADTSVGTELQTSVSTDDAGTGVAPTGVAPTGGIGGSTSPEQTLTGSTDGNWDLQSHADPPPASGDGPSSDNTPAASSPTPEVPNASMTPDLQSSTALGGDVTSSAVAAPGDDEGAVIPVGQGVDLASWTLVARQWQFDHRWFAACVVGLSTGGCSVAQVLDGNWPTRLEAAHVGERGAGAGSGSGRPAQRPKSPRPPAPDHQLPVPMMPGISVGSGTSEGFHGGAVLGLISAVPGHLALAGSRAVTLLGRRPPAAPFVSLLERPG
jgi:hypothetical protein